LPAPTPSPAAAPGTAAPSAGDVRVVLDHRAAAAVAAPGRVVLLEGDFLHLTAVDPATGSEIWRVRVQEDASGQHDLELRGGEIVLKAGPRLFYVDPFAGTVRRQNGGVPHCRFVETAGACAFQCECSLFVATCDEGKEITWLRGSEIHVYHDLGQPHDNVCAFHPYVIGRVGDRIVAVTEDAGRVRTFGADGRLVVLDATTGKELRRGSSIARYDDEVGLVPGTDLCWIGTAPTGAFAVQACTSGAARWQTRVGKEVPHAALTVRATPSGLLVVRTHEQGAEVALFDAASGRASWRRDLGAATVPFFAGEEPGGIYVSDARAYEEIDLETGRTRVSIAVEPRQTLVRDGAGYLVAGAGKLREIDASGATVRTRDHDEPLAHVGPTHLVETPREPQPEVRFVRRSDLALVGRLPGTFSVLPSAALGGRHLVMYRHREQDVGEVVLVELP
jgi:hypothetical protein